MLKKNYSKIILTVIIAASAFLRLYKWNSYSLWFDEEFWLEVRQTSMINSLRDAIFTFKPPLFRFLVYFFQHYLGQHEFILRLLPFTCGMLAIYFMYKLARFLFDEKVALCASFMLAFSPFHIYYSQELTHYSLTCLLAIISCYYLVLSLKQDKVKNWVKYVFFSALSLYSNYVAIFLFLTQNIFFLTCLSKYRKLAKKWIGAQALILLLYLPLLVLLPVTLHYLSAFDQEIPNWIPKGSFAEVFQLARVFNAGYNAGPLLQLFASLLIFPVFFLGLKDLKSSPLKFRLLCLWLFVPIALAMLFSPVYPTFSYRNFIFLLPAYLLIVSAGAARLKKYTGAFLLLAAVLSGFCLRNYYRNIFPYPIDDFYRPGAHAKVDNRSAAQYVIRNFKEGDVVYHSCLSTLVPYYYYLTVFTGSKICDPDDYYAYLSPLFAEKKKDDFFFRPFGSCGGRSGLEFKHYPSFFVSSPEEAQKYAAGHKRVWLFFSRWEPQLLDVDPACAENQVKNWMDANLEQLDYRNFPGIRLYLYRGPVEISDRQ